MSFLSTSVLRRYTPPTCTLEIIGKDSPLSRWAGRSLLKKLRFRLSFDDPRLPDTEQTTITGDRDQLETLCEAVGNYVQDFLSQSPALLSSALAASAPSLGNSSSDHVTELSPASAPRAAAFSLLDRESSLEEVEPAPSSNDFTPDGLVLARLQATSTLHLQPQGLVSHRLFLGPLATEESGPYINLTATQLSDLATALDEYQAEAMTLPELARPGWLQPIPTWAQTAAVVLVTAGLTTAVVKLLDQPSTIQTATTNQPSLDQQQIATQISPSPLGVPSPPLLSQSKLPPPPPVGSTIAPSPGLKTVPVPGTTTLPNAPNITSAPLPAAPIAVDPPQQAAPPPATADAPAPQADAPSAKRTADNATSAPNELALPELESGSVASGAARQGAAPAQEIAPESSDAANTTAEGANNTAFDTIPQVAEIRSYFQERWQPPEGLTQTLEYTLVLSADGTIQRIIPLGQSAGDYIDRTGMPLAGEPFVSPIASGKNPIVRVVLEETGTVRTFLEGYN